MFALKIYSFLISQFQNFAQNGKMVLMKTNRNNLRRQVGVKIAWGARVVYRVVYEEAFLSIAVDIHEGMHSLV